MFLQRLRPLEQLERRVVAVRYSMNEPIVETAELSAGPACAAIVVYLEEGVRRVVVAIRSLSRARLALYEMQGEEFPDATGMAFDAGLSFAESMGFVFDDEKLTKKSGAERQAGLAPLRDLLDLAVLRLPAVPFEEALQIEADPLSGGDLDLDLTKFRDGAAAKAECAAPAEATTPNPVTTLGRVQPIRKRVPGAPAIPPMLRLLASF
jgi:hypothetical protein